MEKIFDKSKICNYIIAGMFLVVSFWFIKEISYSLWKFDMFSLKHFLFLGEKIITGDAFVSLKYLSFIMVLSGSLFITYGGISITLNMDLKEIFKRKENIEEESITSKALKNAKEAVKEDNQKEILKEEEKEKALPIEDTKFSMYDNKEKAVDIKEVIKPEVIKEEKISESIKEAPKPINNQDNKEINDDEEREKLQAKIRETIEKMKKRTVEESEVEEVKSEKILKPFNPIDISPKKESSMNFVKISEEDNSKMETTLISAGFKLLSEIRIGKTGIDYLAAAKDKLVVIQFDTTEGNWLASEDKMSGEDSPFWLSDMGNKISPISRVIEAKADIENLIKGEIDLPVKPIVCLSKSDVVNYFDVTTEWNEKGVEVVRLNDIDEDMSSIDKISSLFEPSSQEPIDEKDMEKLISILENAEIPE